MRGTESMIGRGQSRHRRMLTRRHDRDPERRLLPVATKRPECCVIDPDQINDCRAASWLTVARGSGPKKWEGAGSSRPE